MGKRFSKFVVPKIHIRSKKKDVFSIKKEKKLLAIKNDPERLKKQLSIPPSSPPIQEIKILEEICGNTNLEPDVGGDDLTETEVQKFMQRVSFSTNSACHTRESILSELQNTGILDKSRKHGRSSSLVINRTR